MFVALCKISRNRVPTGRTNNARIRIRLFSRTFCHCSEITIEERNQKRASVLTAFTDKHKQNLFYKQFTSKINRRLQRSKIFALMKHNLLECSQQTLQAIPDVSIRNTKSIGYFMYFFYIDIMLLSLFFVYPLIFVFQKSKLVQDQHVMALQMLLTSSQEHLHHLTESLTSSNA